MTHLANSTDPPSWRRKIDTFVPYILVVLAAWAGGWFFSDQMANDAYDNTLEACYRGNTTVRSPLQGLALSIVNEDDISADIKRAGRVLLNSTEPVDCLTVIDKP